MVDISVPVATNRDTKYKRKPRELDLEIAQATTLWLVFCGWRPGNRVSRDYNVFVDVQSVLFPHVNDHLIS